MTHADLIRVDRPVLWLSIVAVLLAVFNGCAARAPIRRR